MSYADVAASGPKQSAAEKVPSAVPEIAHDDSGVHSLDSLYSSNDHVQSIPSSISYSEQQKFEEEAAQFENEAKHAADEIAREAKDFINTSEHDSRRFTSETHQAAHDFSQKASEKYQQVKSDVEKEYQHLKKEAGVESNKAKKQARKAEDWAQKNKTNPVIIGNGIVISALAGILGVGAYRLHKANNLTWNVVGVWAGAVGLFAVSDYFVSQYLFKRFPPKQ